ncbi:acetate kinase [Rhodoferax koreensis]|nr:acetate kinase [Rhodoferax koreense]
MIFSFVHAQTPPVAQESPSASALSTDERIEALQRQVSEQGRQLELLRRQMAEQADQAARLNAARERAARQAIRDGSVQGQSAAVEPAQAQPPSDATQSVRVGVAPAAPEVPAANVAQLFDQPGVLTPRGKFVFEPSFQYGYSSSNRVALVGYTVIPALLIGLIDVREVKRTVFTGAVTGRWGVSNRLEAEIKVPYVYRSDDTVSREIFTGSAFDNVFNTKGQAIGDIEFAARYQLNQPQPDNPYYIGSLRYKTRTGKSPFDVVTDCQTRCVGNTTGTGLPLDLPTGSGFNSLQAGLTWLFPSDPAVFFGGVSYTRNFQRSNVSRLVLNGERESLGSVKPGDALGLNFGMGLALNDKSTFSVGLDLNSVGKTRLNGAPLAGSVRTQLASLLLGYSYRISPTKTLNVSAAAGLTPDTPNFTLTVRLPITF